MNDERLAMLLFRGIGSLPDEEREAVLVEMVSRGIRRAEPAGPTTMPWRRGNWPSFIEEFAGGVPASGDRRNVLVRLDQAQHERLKAWCQAHDFTMATVLRGLVDRFLESQSSGTEAAGTD